jgi:predicted AAA+ superfamily ATPase
MRCGIAEKCGMRLDGNARVRYNRIMKYIKRIADGILADKLSYSGATLITGPKFCGKTETAAQQSKSQINLETDPSAATAMASDPRVLLIGAAPRLIDEWQTFPLIRNAVRHEVDERRTAGQFILTGSSTPDDEAEARLHSGAGRISRIRMRTMTWSELGWSDGSVSLAGLFAGEKPESSLRELSVQDIAERLSIGGWPALARDSERTALKKNRDYVDNVIESDISRIAGARRDPARVRRLFESYARNIATPAKISTMVNDSGGASEQVKIDRSTVSAYLNDLSRMMIADDLPAWNTHIRSSAKLRVTPKRHLADPSLAVAALGLSSELLLKELNYMGFLFESLVVHDLRIYAEATDAAAYYYLDTDGDEVDAIIEKRDGRFAAFEIKLGIGAVEDAVVSLNRFRAKLTDAKRKDMVSLNVITGSGISYARPDGVNVISIGALGV